MKMLNAWTLEPDDPKIALEEILEQLDLENNLQTHAAGFITCSYDYIESGIVKALCDALPFDVVGETTLGNAINDESRPMLLCLSVLTADDCRFSCALTPPLGKDLSITIDREYTRAASELDSPPNLILAFLPMLSNIGGELMLSALDKATGGVPVFGSVACDFDTAGYTNTFLIHNGECFRDRMPLMLISGNIQPRFVVMATSEQNQFKQQAIITSSEGTVLKSVNGMSASDYFTSIGLVQGRGIEGISSLPFIVDYNDGSQAVALAVLSMNKDDGSALCGGIMPEGGTISLGRMDVEDILRTAEQTLRTLLAEKANGVIIFPCLGRNMVLGADPLAEIKVVQQMIGDSVPWHLAYSGGEACPVYAKNGTVNRFHNFTFIACAF